MTYTTIADNNGWTGEHYHDWNTYAELKNEITKAFKREGLKVTMKKGGGYTLSILFTLKTTEERRNDDESKARAIIASYNHDHSDIMTDYFNVGFYENVNVKIEPTTTNTPTETVTETVTATDAEPETETTTTIAAADNTLTATDDEEALANNMTTLRHMLHTLSNDHTPVTDELLWTERIQLYTGEFTCKVESKRITITPTAALPTLIAKLRDANYWKSGNSYCKRATRKHFRELLAIIG